MAWAVAAGALSGLALCGLGLFWLGWVAWAPLLALARRATVRTCAAAGLAAGAVETAVLLCWIPDAVAGMGHSLALGLAILTGLAAVWGGAVALYLAALAWLRPVLGHRMSPGREAAVFAAAAAGLWVAVEFGFTRAFHGLPFLFFLRGYSQWSQPALLQPAAWGGTHAISFLLVAVNALLADAALRRAWRPAAAALALVAVAWAAGAALLAGGEGPAGLRVAVLQADVDPRERLDPARGRELAQRYLALCREANAAAARLVVWPESAVPWPVQADDDLVACALAATRPSEAAHVVGAPVAAGGAADGYFNAALLVLPDGRIGGRYCKTRPLCLAETPIRWPGAARGFRLHPSPAAFARGAGGAVLAAPAAAVGVTICNENFYADLVRRSVREGAELLVNLTNDGWFRRDMPLREHLLLNTFRAVENRRWMVVANNAGVSALVDPYGRIRQSAPRRAAACLVGDVAPRRELSLYARWGDWFAGLCVAGCTLAGAGRVAVLARWRTDGGSGRGQRRVS